MLIVELCIGVVCVLRAFSVDVSHQYSSDERARLQVFPRVLNRKEALRFYLLLTLVLASF